MQPVQYLHIQPASEVPSRPITQAINAPTTTPVVQKFTPYSSNSFNVNPQHLSLMPTVSWQALRTFAPEHRVVTPDAPHVPIRSLHLGKALVRVSGRTVRTPDVKAFPDRFDSSKRRWLLTFTIKDDVDTIDIKFWHKSQEHLNSYSNITLDQVVHILTDEVKLNSNPATGRQAISAPSTSSPFCLNLSEGKFGHTIDVGSDDQQKSMFKHALGANAVGSIPCMPIKQIIGVIGSLKNQRFNMVVCVKKVVDSRTVTTKNGPLTKTELCVFDAHGAEMSMVLWGDQLTKAVQQWIPFTTVLVLTGAQASVYGLKMQVTLGYQTHIQVDPVCKDVEWLKHFSVQCQELPQDQNPVAEACEITPRQIQSLYGVLDIKNKAESLGILETAYGCTYAVVSELGIDNRSDILTAKCPSCKSAVSSFKMEVCSACNTMPPGEECWRYEITRYISFMDDTGELHHPIVPSAVFQTLLGFKPNEFSALSMVERSQLKKRHFLERVKVFFKLSWSDFKKVPVVEIISIEPVDLYDFESQIEATAA